MKGNGRTRSATVVCVGLLLCLTLRNSKRLGKFNEAQPVVTSGKNATNRSWVLLDIATLDVVPKGVPAEDPSPLKLQYNESTSGASAASGNARPLPVIASQEDALNRSSAPPNVVTQDEALVPPIKKILFYNSFWHWTDFHVGFEQDSFAKCRITSCVASSRPVHSPSVEEMPKFDAIVMHGVEANLSPGDMDYIQTWRQPHQRFVFFMLEPPPNGPLLTSASYNSFWNYTMTYRIDSDVPIPYAFIAPNVDPVEEGNPKGIQIQQSAWPIDYNETHFVRNVLPNKDESFRRLARRPKKVAWVVSRCVSNSHREDFVQELKKYIDVDVYGKCGSFPCDNVDGEENCNSKVMRDYKFYLAFENNFAQDYVTEKFFSRMNDTLVPIVLGQAITAPSSSPFIH
ncbi:alpha-(1-_3)-fucosyltransferase [Fragilaria crotonensis]|nr:alpha-(1->3)-fucosyltransferase [Fragilaria crotonensis]